MQKSTILAVVVVVALVVFRVLFGASQMAAAAGLGRTSKYPKSWRRWLFGEKSAPSKN
jgi:hypothetical protein